MNNALKFSASPAPCPRHDYHGHGPRGHVYGILTGLLWLCTYGAGAAPAVDPLEMQVDTLTAQALNAVTLDAAQEKIAEAEQLLTNNQTKFKPLTCRFLQTNLELTKGRIKAALWRQKQNDEKLRKQAQQILARILPEQETLKLDTRKAADEQEQKLGPKADENPWLQQLWAYAARIEYNVAWSQYSLALVTPDENARLQLLQKAFEGFQPFTQDGYQNHPVIAECFLGQALCLFEQKKYYEVIHFLDLEKITPDATPAETYKRISVLRIQSARQLPSDLNAVWAAEQFFNSLDDDERLDKTELDMALDWARALTELAQSPETRNYHHSLLQRIERVASLVYPYGDPFSANLAHIIEELPVDMPYASMVRGRRLFQEKHYEAALQYAQTGIRSLTENVSEKLSADLFYLQNAAAWSVKAWQPAFRAAQVFLRRHTEDDRSEKVLQRGIQAALKSLNSDSTVDLEAFMQFLDFAAEQWPDHPEVKKAPWYRGWVFLETQRYSEARRVLQTVTPDSTVYSQALYGLALTSFKQARNLSNEKPSKQKTEEKLSRREHLHNASGSIERFVNLSTEKPSRRQEELHTAVLEVGTAVAQDLLNLTPPDPNAALHLIDTLERLPGIAGADDPDLLHNYISSPRKKNADKNSNLQRRLALRLEAYADAENITRLYEVLDLLIKIETHSEFTLHALIRAGNALEKVAPDPSRSDPSKRILYDKLIELYEFLLTQTLKHSHAMIAESTVRRRLAHSLARGGRRLDAVEQYHWILQHEPADKTGDVRRSLALVYEQLERFDAAREQWRILAQGLPPQTEPWLEANYRLILGHRNAGDRRQAKKLLTLFQLRHPRIESQTWRRRFDELDQKLQSDPPSNKVK